MTMSANLHRPDRVEAKQQDDIGVLSFDSADGSYINVFLPYTQAKAMADAFNAKQPAAFATSA